MADDVRRENQVKFRDQSHRICGNSRFYCNKICLLVFVLFYLIIGLGLLGIGVWVEIERQNYKSINNHLALPVALLIFVGLFIILSALCGIIGTVKENSTLLKLYLCITVVSLMVQVTVGVMAFIYRQQIPSILSSELMFAIREYSENTDLKRVMDFIQSKYKCCGWKSFEDYEENFFYSCSSSKDRNGTCGIPDSCCDNSQGAVTQHCGFGTRDPKTTQQNRFYTNGCLSAFLDWLENNIDLVGAAALGFALPQIIGILLAYFFIRGVEDRRCWYTVADNLDKD